MDAGRGKTVDVDYLIFPSFLIPSCMLLSILGILIFGVPLICIHHPLPRHHTHHLYAGYPAKSTCSLPLSCLCAFPDKIIITCYLCGANNSVILWSAACDETNLYCQSCPHTGTHYYFCQPSKRRALRVWKCRACNH